MPKLLSVAGGVHVIASVRASRRVTVSTALFGNNAFTLPPSNVASYTPPPRLVPLDTQAKSTPTPELPPSMTPNDTMLSPTSPYHSPPDSESVAAARRMCDGIVGSSVCATLHPPLAPHWNRAAGNVSVDRNS